MLRLTALVGLALVAIVGRNAAGIPAFVLMLAPGVVVPLGLAVTLDRASTRLQWVLVWASPLGVAGGVLGWLFPPGDRLAIAGALLHAIVCVLVGLVGLERLWSRRAATFGPLPEIALDVGLLLLPVGGVWFAASRAGMPLGGFQEPVVTFTAAHFHYAGFAAPTILGGVGRFVRSRIYAVAAIAVCAGVPLTAIGIATNHTVEAIAAVLLASGMLCASALLVFVTSRRAYRDGAKAAAVLFVLSGGTLLLTMALAATFALTSSAGIGSTLTGAVPLQTMIDWHGGANAIGFSLLGLVALAVRNGAPDSAGPPRAARSLGVTLQRPRP